MLDPNSETGIGVPEHEQNKPLHILLVEDNLPITSLLIEVLKGHTIENTTTAENAIEILRKAKKEGKGFDWVITDKGLAGEGDGFTVAEAIQSEKLGCPFVTMFTGSAKDVLDENPGDRLQERGVHDIIAKPFRIKEFVEKIPEVRKFLQKVRSQ